MDLAAASGGNCELTVPGQEVVAANGVQIIAAAELAATMPTHASSLFARNVSSFVDLLVKDGQLVPDFSDEIVDKSAVTGRGPCTTKPPAKPWKEASRDHRWL